MRGSGAFRTSAAPGGALAGPWVRNPLWRNARAVPSLDLDFANNKSLIDRVTGQNLVTFTRASSATYVDSSGVLQRAVTNLLLNSEDFSAATWNADFATVTTNTTVAPNSTTTADQILESTATNYHSIYANTLNTFTTCTSSIYVKPSGRTNVGLRFYYVSGDWIVTVFDLTGNGSVTQSSAGSSSLFSAVSSSIVNAGNGFYRISMTATQPSRATYALGVDIYTSPTPTLSAGNGTQTYTGDITKGVFVWGAQLEQASTVGDYVPTGATINSAPRFDHNPTTGESLGLLVEEARTNLLLRSEELENAAWTKVGSTISANAITSPTGAITADTLVEDTSTGTHRCLITATIANTTIYTVSVYAKAAGRTHVRLSAGSGLAGEIIANLSNGTVASSSGATNPTVQSVGNGWYRVSFTTAASTGTTGQVQVQLVQGTSTTSYTGDGTSGIYLWGAQLEAGAFPTSYIPTTSATATRAADLASITGSNFSFWYNHNEGTLLASASMRGVNTSPLTGTVTINGVAKLAESTATSNSRVLTFNGSVTPNRFSFAQRSSVSNIQINDAAYETIQFGKTYNLVGSYVNNSTQGVAFSVDGRTPITNSTAVDVPVPARLLIGAGNSGAVSGLTADEFYLNGTIKRLTYWPTRLANTTLQQITQP
jgi:hypothetical protein